jgi:excisionase family DNA binding protein
MIRMLAKTYLTVDEVAQKFGVNATTIYRLAQQGKLPGFKMGGQWRFSESMLNRWVNARVAQRWLQADGS